jgi:hypothetical protein
MPKILIRAGKRPDASLSPEASLAASKFGVFGTNSGNLLFSAAVFRALSVPGVEVVPDSLLLERAAPTDADVDRINAEFDAYVVPLANAFRPQFLGALRRLTAFLERLTIPVVVVGVGVQLPIDGDSSAVSAELKDGVLAFAKAVLDRSSSIGVRGEVTARFLRDLGLPDDAVDVIGCPSIYDAGPGLTLARRTDRITADSRIAFNTALANPGAGRFVERLTEAFPNAVFIGQSNLELELLLWGTPIARQQPGVPATVEHRLYREDRLRFFVDPSTWVRYLGGRDFSIGARIHGNVAALLAGTPAVVLAADARTLELADYHAVPYRVSPSLDMDLDVARVYDEVDLDAFNRRVPENFARYTAFLDRNGLAHGAGDPTATAEFDARVTAQAFPGPVGTPMGRDGVRLLLDRLQWLRQTSPTDDVRVREEYIPPFAPSGSTRRPTPLERRVTELERTVQRMEARPASLVGRLPQRLRRHATRFVKPLRRPARR